MSSPLVAVVMPAYNAERHIGAAIESVLAQTHENWFLSICNDGSRDETDGIAWGHWDKSLPEQVVGRRRVKAKMDCNGHDWSEGVSAARNTAYARIPREAEYVLFLDADDTLAPDALETLIARAETSHLAGAVVGDAAQIDSGGKPCAPKYRYASPPAGKLLSFTDILNADPGIFPPSRILFRRWVVDAAGPWNPAIEATEDHDFYLRCALHAPFCYTPGVVTHYRNHDGNRTDDRAATERALARRWALQDAYKAAWTARGGKY